MPYAGLIDQQNQNVKTDLFVGAFVVILPLSLLAGLWLADAIASGAERRRRCRRSPPRWRARSRSC